MADRLPSRPFFVAVFVPFVEITRRDRLIRLEYDWVGVTDPHAPLVVFLHEGLGSLEMWRAYPRDLCVAGGWRGLVYSRYGYGRSTPRPSDERWNPDYLHEQARDAVPALLQAVGVGAERPWLFGHSDGATIALLYAATYPDALRGATVLAPHVFVEDVARAGIAMTRQRYESAELRDRLAQYHADPDSAFWGWHDAWMDPAFRSWTIQDSLSAITCPVLAIQGYEDEYGTMAQLDAISRGVACVECVRLEQCGHVPYRDAPDAVTRATIDFVRRYG